MESVYTPTRLNKHGFLSIIGGVCIHLVIGAFYLWGSVNVYLTSYYRSTGANPDLTLALAAIVMPFMDLTFTIGNMLGVELDSRIGLRKTCFLSIILLSLSSFVAGYMPNFWLFVLFYGGSFGIWSGVVYSLPIFNAFSYFPSKKGVITGTILGAFGFGSFISSNIATTIINPHNINPTFNQATKESYFEPLVSERSLTCIKIISAYFLIMGTIGVLFMTPFTATSKPDEKGEKELAKQLIDQKDRVDEKAGVMEPLEIASADEKKLYEEVNLASKDLTRRKEFWMIGVLMIIPSGLGYVIANNFKNYGQTFIKDDHFLTTTGSVASVFNGVSRVLWGALFDKFGFTKTYRLLLLILIIVGTTIDHLKDYQWIYIIHVSLSFSCLGGLYVLLPPLCEKVYGKSMAATMFGYLFFGFVISDWIQFVVILFGYEDFGYEKVFLFYTLMNVILFIASFLLKKLSKNIE